MFKEYINLFYDIKPDQLMFPWGAHHIINELKRISKATGVKRITTHQHRHSHASLMIQQGVNPILVQERLGHEDIETTLDMYSHLYPNKQHNLVKKLDELF